VERAKQTSKSAGEAREKKYVNQAELLHVGDEKPQRIEEDLRWEAQHGFRGGGVTYARLGEK